MKSSWRIRLSTLLLLLAVFALSFGLFLQKHRREVNSTQHLHYRDPAAEAIIHTAGPAAALTYPDGARACRRAGRTSGCARRDRSCRQGCRSMSIPSVCRRQTKRWLRRSKKCTIKASRSANDPHILKPLGLGFTTRVES